jgi:predicted metalloprotease
MRLDDYRTSDNVGEQRGGGFGGGGGGLGGGAMGMILGLVASRFGIGGVLVLIAGAWLLGFSPFGGGSGVVSPGAQVAPAGGSSAAQVCAADQTRRFTCQVLASTEDTWATVFKELGQQYRPAGLDFYTGSGRSGCGAAQSAMGPFYCPTDNKIYIDASFYNELQNRFGAAGDFAQAYVIAHEVGHHIQFLTGTLEQANTAQQRLSKAEGNAVQVRVELQADCYAGVWAARNRARLEQGDVEEGMRAAEAIGDDTLQRKGQGRVVPESFTHGSSAQRMAWLRKGLQTGDPRACDTFNGAV